MEQDPEYREVQHRHSKRRAYFEQRRRRHLSLMYRPSKNPLDVAQRIDVSSQRVPNRYLRARATWPNIVAAYPKLVPFYQNGEYRMRYGVFVVYTGSFVDAFDIETGALIYSVAAHEKPICSISLCSGTKHFNL